MRYPRSVTREAISIRRWVKGRRAAEAREREEMHKDAPRAADAFRRALDLMALTRQVHHGVTSDDERTLAEEAEARRRWARLRHALGHRRG